jgi:crossover junction endodeoxyribonuclease RuvC
MSATRSWPRSADRRHAGRGSCRVAARFVDCIERSFECRQGGAALRVLGIDPGLTRCGLGVVDGSPGRPPSLVHMGVLRTPPELASSERLRCIADEIEARVAEHRPDVMAVERVFSQQNVRTVMGTAQVSGVAMLLAARAGIPVAGTPSRVKAAVTGSGSGRRQVGGWSVGCSGWPTCPSGGRRRRHWRSATFGGAARRRLDRAAAVLMGTLEPSFDPQTLRGVPRPGRARRASTRRNDQPARRVTG